VLFGAADDRLLALDATSGRLLWSFTAGGGVHAAPISYLVRGKQRLTVAAGRALLTFGID
jgi:quinohemoprotein ethanol dehydrogenase